MDQSRSSDHAFEARRQLEGRWEALRTELLALAASRMVGRDDLAPYLGKGGPGDGEALRAAWRRFLSLALDGLFAEPSTGSGHEGLADEIIQLAWWGELRHAMMPIATRRLAQRLGVVRYLEGASNRDPDAAKGVAADAALLSAWTSFERQFGDRGLGEDAAGLDLECLADHLIRIARTRRQREFRSGKTMARRVASGAAGGDSGDSALAQAAGSGPGADQIAELADFSAYLDREVDLLMKDYEDRPSRLAVIRAYLLDPRRSQIDLAAEVGVNQSTVSRYIQEFRDRVRKRVRE